MADIQIFEPGDQVIHPKRPEWGTGVVDQAHHLVYQGEQAQRLVITFARRGRITINTAVAPLQFRESKAAIMTDTTATTGRGWLEALADKRAEHELHRLPDSLTDPFSGHPERLSAMLENYRFTAEPRPLMDWAVAQTGLDDPLTRYTRQELEQEFKRFVYYRHKALVDLVKAIRREGHTPLLDEAIKQAKYPAAVAALKAAMRD